MKNLLCLLVVLFSGCSSLPPAIQSAPADDIQPQQITRSNIEQYRGSAVRWGGKIIKVNNDDSQSVIQLLAYPLASYGNVRSNKDNQGRFLAITNQFLDPEVYEQGRFVTFAGTISSQQTVLIDKKSLELPVISITEMHLWPEKSLDQSHYYLDHHRGRYVGYGYYGTGSYYP
ncbi:hypothetical protein A9Q92_01150 [Methylophaga sp. 42_8_T64]|nr:hypothetical protein A9Q78_03700 [Methylophaga sp. 41_12_T18]OUR89402.1 hypothetical protein A9Q92_01150 [Methylophaga sp. 42_8_T64]